MQPSLRSWRSWHFWAALLVIAALAQACGGSSQSSGPTGTRLELRFNQVKTTRLGALPQGCTAVNITFQPGNLVFAINDTQGSILIPAGQYVVSAVVICNGTPFPSDKPDPIVNVPAGLQQVQVSFVFGGVNVILTVRVANGVRVTGPGIDCPGDCTESVFAGTTVPLKATPSNAQFSGGGCNSTGACDVLLNQDKTVFAGGGEGAIRVLNTGGESGLQIAIDGSTVDPNLGPGQSLTRSASTGNHSVAAFCDFGEPVELFDSPKTATVGPGQTAQVSFDGDQCFQIGQRPRKAAR